MKLPEFSKYAVQRGSPAYMTCRAAAVPAANFIWHMESEITQVSKEVNPTDPNR